jgi:anti-anti-sigma factor
MKRHYLAMLRSPGRDSDVIDGAAPTRRPVAAEVDARKAVALGTVVVETLDRTHETRPARARGAPAAAAPVRAIGPISGMHTLTLTGELDRASAHTLEAAIERLCEAGTAAITLDLSRLDYIDSTGVAVVAFRSGLCQRRGYEFALIPGAWFIQRAFELAGLVEQLPFVSTRPAPEQPGAELRRERPPGASTRASDA